MINYLIKNRLFSIYVLFLAAYSICSTLIAFVLSSILNRAADGTMKELISTTIFAVIYLILYIIIFFIYGKLKYYLLKESSRQLKNDLFSAILKKSIVDYEKLNSAAYMNELTTNAGMMEEMYFKNILDVGCLIISFITAIIATVMLSPLLLAVMIILAIITVVITNRVSRKLEQSSADYTNSAKEYSIVLKEYFTGFRLIKTFQLSNHIEKMHQNKNEITEEKKRIRRNKILLCNCAGEFIGFLSTIIVMAIAAGFALKGLIPIGSVFVVGHLIGRITSPISSMPDIIVNFKSSVPIKNFFRELLNCIPESEEGDSLSKIDKEIRLANVNFSYDGEKKILDQLTMTFEKGKKYAIIGESGSGKTTLFLLLLGYYKNYEGSILFDDKEVKNTKVSDIYKMIGIVSQETFLFEDTLRNNLTLYENHNEEDILLAVKKAKLSGFLNNLPEGLNSKITENGRNLSGGERQRISLARVLLKNFPVLLFDEFTSSLDTDNAYEIEKHILTLSNKTILTITHRLNKDLIKHYDQIFDLTIR